MLRTRLLLQGDKTGVYFEIHERALAQRYRKNHPKYFGKHIKEVLHDDLHDPRLGSGKEFVFWGYE